MLDKLMYYAEACKEFETGIIYGTRILVFDRASEHTHRQLMRLKYLSGNRTGALRQYESCTAALDEELSVKPAQSTSALFEQIRADKLQDPPHTPGTAAGVDREATVFVLPELLTRLKQVQELLADVQNVVQVDIQAVELLLKRLP